MCVVKTIGVVFESWVPNSVHKCGPVSCSFIHSRDFNVTNSSFTKVGNNRFGEMFAMIFEHSTHFRLKVKIKDQILLIR